MTLTIGMVGGALAHLAAMPLAWILGPAFAVAVAGFAGVEVRVPPRFRMAVLVVLGTFIGSAFSPEILAQVHRWPWSLAAVVLFTPLITISAAYCYRRFARLDPVSAFFAATPGGLASMVVLGGMFGGDEPRMSLLHSLRVVTLVLLAPLLVIGFGGGGETGLPQIGTGGPIGPADGALLAVAVVAGVLLAAACRVPAPQMTGALVISSVLHLTGVIHGTPPSWLLLLTLVVLGSALGCQFAAIRLVGLLRVAVVGATVTLVLLLATALITYVLSQAIGIDFLPMLLAMAPGGVPEMSLVALAMGLDPAFVALHHLARITLILLVAPHIGRAIARRYGVSGRAAD